MGNVSGTNARDFIKGARAYIGIAPYILPTAGVPTDATSTLVYTGFVDDVTFDAQTEINKIQAGNCFLPIDGYVKGRDFQLKFTFKEGRLRHLLQAMMDDPAASTGDLTVTGGGTPATWALDEQQAMRYWQVHCTLADQYMLPAYSEDAAQEYTQRKIVLYRCLLETKTSAKLVRDGEWSVPCTVHAFIDSGITYTKGTYGRIGKVVDSA